MWINSVGINRVYKDYNLVLGYTFTAVLPHTQIDLGHVLAVSIFAREVCHGEDVRLNAGNVVTVVTQHPRERRLLQLSQLSWAKHTRVLIPEPQNMKQIKEMRIVQCGMVRKAETANLILQWALC